MRECAHFVPHLHKNSAIRFLSSGAKSLGTKSKGWLRGLDLNQRPLGYEPNELPDCSTPQPYPIAVRRARQPPTRSAPKSATSATNIATWRAVGGSMNRNQRARVADGRGVRAGAALPRSSRSAMGA